MPTDLDRRPAGPPIRTDITGLAPAANAGSQWVRHLFDNYPTRPRIDGVYAAMSDLGSCTRYLALQALTGHPVTVADPATGEQVQVPYTAPDPVPADVRWLADLGDHARAHFVQAVNRKMRSVGLDVDTDVRLVRPGVTAGTADVVVHAGDGQAVVVDFMSWTKPGGKVERRTGPKDNAQLGAKVVMVEDTLAVEVIGAWLINFGPDQLGRYESAEWGIEYEWAGDDLDRLRAAGAWVLHLADAGRRIVEGGEIPAARIPEKGVDAAVEDPSASTFRDTPTSTPRKWVGCARCPHRQTCMRLPRRERASIDGDLPAAVQGLLLDEIITHTPGPVPDGGSTQEASQ